MGCKNQKSPDLQLAERFDFFIAQTVPFCQKNKGVISVHSACTLIPFADPLFQGFVVGEMNVDISQTGAGNSEGRILKGNEILCKIAVQIMDELYKVGLERHEVHCGRAKLQSQVMENMSSDAIGAEEGCGTIDDSFPELVSSANCQRIVIGPKTVNFFLEAHKRLLMLVK